MGSDDPGSLWHIHGLGGDHDDDHEAADHDHGDGVEEHHHRGSIDADSPVIETFDGPLPGLPAILVKPRSVADAYRLRQEYRSSVAGTLAVFPGEVPARLYSTLGDARTILMSAARGLVAASPILITVIHVT